MANENDHILRVVGTLWEILKDSLKGRDLYITLHWNGRAKTFFESMLYVVKKIYDEYIVEKAQKKRNQIISVENHDLLIEAHREIFLLGRWNDAVDWMTKSAEGIFSLLDKLGKKRLNP